jgi:hypothetical protein
VLTPGTTPGNSTQGSGGEIRRSLSRAKVTTSHFDLRFAALVKVRDVNRRHLASRSVFVRCRCLNRLE